MADELLDTFNGLKEILSKYEPPLVAKTNYQTRYELVFDRPFETKSKKTGNIIKKDELHFAAIIVQSGYVGLYFMPIYSHTKEFKGVSCDLMKLLKGKTCFHVKNLDKELTSEIKKMISKGYLLYKNFEGV